MSKIAGYECKLYRSSTVMAASDFASIAAKTWTVIPNVRDLTLNIETGEADITTRANSGWKQTMATLKDGSIEFEMVWDNTDADFLAIKNAWRDKTEIAIAAMDGAIATSGNQGLVTNCYVTNFSRNEALDDAVKMSITMKPSSYSAWYVVGASS